MKAQYFVIIHDQVLNLFFVCFDKEIDNDGSHWSPYVSGWIEPWEVGQLMGGN